jgi:hypothetical protein
MNKAFFLVLAAIVLPTITGTTLLGKGDVPRPILGPTSRAVSHQDLDLLRKDVRSLKKQIVAHNMDLTDDEAVNFWPGYEKYTAEVTTVHDRKFAPLQSYAANCDTLTSEQAYNYTTSRSKVEEAIMELGLKCYPLFRQVLSGKSIARLFQMDWGLGLILELQLAS